jgi:tetratricopeptide (TPR) repeat protein
MFHEHSMASLFILFLFCCSTASADVHVVQTINGLNTTLENLPQQPGLNFASLSAEDILGWRSSSKPTEVVIIDNISFSINTSDKQNIESQIRSKSLFDEAKTYYSSGLYNRALSSINRSLENYSNNSNAWTFKGILLQAINRSFEAIKYYDFAIKIYSGNAVAWNNKGVALYKMGEFEEAISCYNNSTILDPSNSIFGNNRELAIRKLQTRILP